MITNIHIVYFYFKNIFFRSIQPDITITQSKKDAPLIPMHTNDKALIMIKTN